MARMQKYMGEYSLSGSCGLGINIRESGCRGHKLTLEEVTHMSNRWKEIQDHKGCKIPYIFINRACDLVPGDLEVDHEDNGIDCKFVFKHMYAKCGCGSSFYLNKE